MKIDKFTKAYIEAMYFTESNNESGITVNTEISAEAMDKIIADCAKFQEIAGDLIAGERKRPSGYSDYEMAGHDFWLTRNKHGAGFWDGDWLEVGDRLTEIADEFREVWVELGDDGMIYMSK